MPRVSAVATSPPRKLRVPVRLLVYGSVPALLIGVGTVGFHLLERWSWFDSFYVAVTTLTSIGYGERAPVTLGGRVFTLALALGGIFTIAAAATELLSIIITGEFREFWGRRQMHKRIEALRQHVIVCGYGRVGQYVCAELLGGGIPVVVVDRKGARLAAASGTGAHVLLGDATLDATLRRAGLDRARALIAAAGTDPENVLITMTARLLGPDLPIVSRALDEGTVQKLLRAGASQAVTPHAILGSRLVEAVLR